MKYYVNENIKNTVRIFPRQKRYNCLRYDMNENPEGLPKDFVDSVLKEITPEFLAIYPEPDKFLNKYANFIGAQYENVVATNGSDMAIRYILETFGETGKSVVTVSPSFEMYWVNCNILGLKHKPVAYNDDLTINIENIINAIDLDTRVVVLLNPNNPVGNVYTEEEFRLVLKRTQEVGAILVVDEAYHYFYKNWKKFYVICENLQNCITDLWKLDYRPFENASPIFGFTFQEQTVYDGRNTGCDRKERKSCVIQNFYQKAAPSDL